MLISNYIVHSLPVLLLLHGDILPYVAPSAVSDVGPKILSLVSPLCFIPKSGYLVARKNGSLKKPFWGYWYFGFTCFSPSRCSAIG